MGTAKACTSAISGWGDYHLLCPSAFARKKGLHMEQGHGNEHWRQSKSRRTCTNDGRAFFAHMVKHRACTLRMGPSCHSRTNLAVSHELMTATWPASSISCQAEYNVSRYDDPGIPLCAATTDSGSAHLKRLGGSLTGSALEASTSQSVRSWP